MLLLIVAHVHTNSPRSNYHKQDTMSDCCIPIIIICGSRTFIRRKEAKEESIPFLKQVYFCHNCRCYRQAGYFKRSDWFTLCFIPLFPCHLGKRYLGCDVCRRPLDASEVGRKCRRVGCEVINDSRNRYCQSCGHDQNT